MSEHINDGGPAFPSSYEFDSVSHITPGEIGASQRISVSTPGMTLRDYFAAKEVIAEDEMTSSLAKALMGSEVPVSDGSREKVIALYTWWAQAESRYKFLRADAMLKAREVKE